MSSSSNIYLIPAVLDENAVQTIPLYILEAVKKCQVIFAENERTTRRFLKSLDKNIIIDDFEWFAIHKAEADILKTFAEKIKQNKNIAIISEAGAPGIADPGQVLINKAHQLKATVRPLVGPSSVLLALMASGLNGQQFTFNGYLPIDNGQRINKLKSLEEESLKRNVTQMFIETPYRNNAMLEAILKTCRPSTLLSIAMELTAPSEFIRTQSIAEWKLQQIDLHKKPVMFLMLAV